MGGKLVVAHPDRKAQRMLQRLVGATLCPVEVVSEVEALAAAVEPDTIAVVHAAFATARPALREQPARAWIAVPGDGTDPMDPAAIDALLLAGWTHVIANPRPLLEEELLATVQKLRRDDVFGLEKYIAWGAEVRSYAIADASDREGAVAAIAADVASVGLPDRTSSMVSVIADELLAHAMYLAPVDASGRRHRADDSRDSRRALVGRDAVTVRWATDARYLAIEVRDRWGSLDGTALPPRLASTAAQLPQAEGSLGLPLVYACCHQLVVNVAPGAFGELVALLDVRHKPTELARAASFHAFTSTAHLP